VKSGFNSLQGHILVSVALGSSELDTALPPELRRQEGSSASACWLHSSSCSPGHIGLFSWHTLNFWSTGTPKAFSSKLFSCLSVTSLHDTQSCLFPVAGLCTSLHEVPLGPFLQLANISLNGNTTMWWINHSSQFYRFCKHAEGALCPIIYVINEDCKAVLPQYHLTLLPPLVCFLILSSVRSSMLIHGGLLSPVLNFLLIHLAHS